MNFRDYWLFITGVALLLVISTIDNSITYVKKYKHKHKNYSYNDSLNIDSVTIIIDKNQVKK